jgi:hypothetical protein
MPWNHSSYAPNQSAADSITHSIALALRLRSDDNDLIQRPICIVSVEWTANQALAVHQLKHPDAEG